LEIPVILMTGHPMDTETEDLKALGVSAYLLKPLQPQQLAVALHDALYLATTTVDAPQNAPAPEG
jgi:CheY-like chemotaxis protein